MSRRRRFFGTEMLPGFLEELWIRDIHPSASALRDANDHTDSLILSIREKGVLQPLVVRPLQEGFEVVAGNRRLRACHMLRMKKVPCYVVGLDEKQAYEVSLIENLQRRDLNPIEEAKAFRRYVDDYGYGGLSELARRIGKSQPYVSKRLALLDLPKAVQDDIIRLRITPSIAEELSSLGSNAARKLADQIGTQYITRSDVREAVRKVREAELTNKLNGYTEEDAARRRIDRAMSKCATSLKMCLMQIDDIIDHLDENEWIVRREALIRYRRSLHQFMDESIALKKRGDSYARFLDFGPVGVKETTTVPVPPKPSRHR